MARRVAGRCHPHTPPCTFPTRQTAARCCTVRVRSLVSCPPPPRARQRARARAGKATGVMLLIAHRTGADKFRTVLRKMVQQGRAASAELFEALSKPAAEAGSVATAATLAQSRVHLYYGTDGFLRMVQKTTGERGDARAMSPRFAHTQHAARGAGQDLGHGFAEQWIYGSGVPHFHLGVHFNRKTNNAEVVLEQRVPVGGRLFVGEVVIRVMELDRPYDYKQRVEKERHMWMFSCHSKVHLLPARAAVWRIVVLKRTMRCNRCGKSGDDVRKRLGRSKHATIHP